MKNFFIDEREKGKFVLILLIILFYAFFIYETAIGNLHFISKPEVYIVVILFLFVVKKTREFIRDWVLFIAILYLFDALRGFAFFTIVKYHRRYFMMYVLKLERLIFGGKTLTEILQHIFWHGKITFFEKFLTSIHASHFFIFIVVGLFIWIDNREKFYKYISGLTVVMFLGALGYILIPTAPPWVAAEKCVMPLFERIITHVYKDISPTLLSVFDTNPVAAMPSIHAAFPFFIFLFTLKYYRLRYKIISFVYFLSLVFAITYCGEHYFVDVIGGCIVASIGFLLIPLITPYVEKITKIDGKDFKLPSKIILISLIIIFFSSFLGKITNASEYFNNNPDYLSLSFINNELEGNSILAPYYKAEYYLMTKSYDKAIFYSKIAISTILKKMPQIVNKDEKIYLIEKITDAKIIFARAYVLKNYNGNKKKFLETLTKDKKKFTTEMFYIILKESYARKYIGKKDLKEILH